MPIRVKSLKTTGLIGAKTDVRREFVFAVGLNDDDAGGIHTARSNLSCLDCIEIGFSQLTREVRLYPGACLQRVGCDDGPVVLSLGLTVLTCARPLVLAPACVLSPFSQRRAAIVVAVSGLCAGHTPSEPSI